MTIIVYDPIAKAVHSDSLAVAYEAIMNSSTQKVFKTQYQGKPAIFALCGKYNTAIDIINNLEQAIYEFAISPSDEPEDAFSGLLITSTDHYVICNKNPVFIKQPKNDEIYVDGSGYAYALGVLRLGGSIAQAIFAATKCDIYCGGDMQSMQFEGGKIVEFITQLHPDELLIL